MTETPVKESLTRKRQRTDSFYPRRRSIMACNVCRARKSRCDNVRPSCGFCVSSGADCVYEDSRSDFSNYDSATLHILNRLDNLESRMEEGFNHSECVDLNRSLAIIHEIELESSPLSASSEGPGEAQTDSDLRTEGDSLVDPEVIGSAIESFLQNVHSKNPILEPQSLKDAARECAKNGFSHNVQSALVATACALGLVSSPYRASRMAASDGGRAMFLTPELRTLAQSYITRGREILISQLPSLSTIQCLFFSGVYEMFCLRPVPAWLHFSQASLQLKLQIHRRSFSPEGFRDADGRLVQRLYWSCMQSECELANELRVASTGLENLPFPYAFPRPPVVTPNSSENLDVDPNDLHSWMYYLSETSLRRIGNEIIWSFYSQHPSQWVRNISSMQIQVDQLNQKLGAWINNLPSDLRVTGSIFDSTNELGLHVRSRYLMCQTWLLLPFLYFMIHGPQSLLLQHRKDVEPLAHECLQSSIKSIEDATYHHRHHGLWYTLRITFSGAVCLLAAAQVNSIPMPYGWEDAVQTAMRTLKRWSSDSKNLQASLEILLRLWEATQE
ncbi:Positive regulator of purine utilization 6 [Colletotrichum chlorophyti]|uniref:Positive regulator of purine utilization 6 n=1 Tax=Colletotrichum chlorophyti TaxID=708187 RepID=A0A1Q8S7C6_9PEZI|nr:Positive regulator of purine utilization 6 [Colletotrichum chlorophyti]